MTRRDTNPFVTVVSVGGLLPTPLLERLATEPDSLPATGPDDYELLPGRRLRTAINDAYDGLRGAWTAFQHALRSLAADDLAVRVTRERWILHLLRELGWTGIEPVGRLAVDHDGPTGSEQREWPITHEWAGRVPLHLLGWNVDLDTRTPGVAGAATASPHAVLQDFLNASPDHLWGIVTNGRLLRILRDSTSLTRQSYLEFDLATMFDNEVFTDFTVLWMACHRTRFPSAGNRQGILETWQDAAHDQGVRALEQLRAGVTTAIEALGTGLLSHPANSALRAALHTGALDRQDLYRQLLRLVYRLVFLFVVEDRDLLHPLDAGPQRRVYEEHYSTARLRERARRHRGGQHPDAWQQLTVLLDGLARPDGIPTLGLPSLAGGLFDPDWTPALDGTQMDNRHLFRAIRSLAYTQRSGALHRIDYRNLGSEELGSVYESLLELNPQIDPNARTVTLTTLAGHERKTTGAYYTPTSLIAQVLDDALDPVVDEVTADLPRADAEQAILALTVCDAAVGSAHFLVAAAHRLAKRLAAVRTGDPEPAPMAVQQALRDVVSRCIYGVDVNPMAVELAKVSLWLECHVPGQPLTFLDHHIKTGNSLLGVHEADLIAWNPDAKAAAEQGGIYDAAFKALQGDDRDAVNDAKKHNRKLRSAGRQTILSFTDPAAEVPEQLPGQAAALAEMDDATLDALHAKRRAWRDLETSEELRRLRLVADAWCATFTTPKTDTTVRDQAQRPWDVYYALAAGQDLPNDNAGVVATRREAERHRFFHWHAEFPHVHAAGGFDVLLSNPPWERIKIQEKEWFASRAPDIATATNKAARDRLIRALYDADEGSPDHALAQEWDVAQHAAAAQSHFLRASGAYPLGGVGDVNTYAVFADLFRQLIKPTGRAGFICPTGLAVGATYADFFSHLVATRTIATFYSFENEDKVFPEVHNETKFALVTLTGTDRPVETIAFTGYVRQAAQIHDPDRRYELKPGDIEAINPNTLTAPLFRYARDADVTATIHRNAPVLVRDDDPDGNPWRLTFHTRLFHTAEDSHLFLSRDEAVGMGGKPSGNTFALPDGSRLQPLYEGKMVWHYDHRYGTYEGQTQKQANKGVLPHVGDEAHSQPDFRVTPMYWVRENHYEAAIRNRWDRHWLLGWRDVGPSERTLVTAVVPAGPVAHSVILAFPRAAEQEIAVLVAAMSSLACDYSVRQRSSRMSLSVVKQAPVFGPAVARRPAPWPSELLIDFVVPRVVELSYTAWDLDGFADDCGMAGPPFRWDTDRRPVLQAELDALFFHLYGLERDDVDWVLDTFTVLRKYEERSPSRGGVGEYRTKRLVLELYDAMAKAIATGEPYDTPLDVPPGDDSLRHPADTRPRG
jgi:hypothetical protein